MWMPKYTAMRYLFENGIDVATFKENVVNKDGTTMIFRFELSECKTEQDVKNLMAKYV